jgi:hypothetical protein
MVSQETSAALRVRREIREISDEERRSVFQALMTMKQMSTVDGQKMYGANYINYDALVVKHLIASADRRCDQGHLGAAFSTFHRAFLLQFEESMIAVGQGSFSALPYWNYNIDANMEEPRASILWTDEWFGNSEGDSQNENMVMDGFFVKSGWEIRQNAYEISDIANPFGLLRSPWNNNPSPGLTRHRFSCGSETVFTEQFWEACLDRNSYMEWNACIDPTVHTWAHSFLGGVWNAGERNVSRVQCYARNAVLVPLLYTKVCMLGLREVTLKWGGAE